jgi:hypothetical protein
MGGTGSFNRNNRTLYIAGFKMFAGDNPDEVLRRHMGEWGEIETRAQNPIPGLPAVRFSSPHIPASERHPRPSHGVCDVQAARHSRVRQGGNGQPEARRTARKVYLSDAGLVWTTRR